MKEKRLTQSILKEPWFYEINPVVPVDLREGDRTDIAELNAFVQAFLERFTPDEKWDVSEDIVDAGFRTDRAALEWPDGFGIVNNLRLVLLREDFLERYDFEIIYGYKTDKYLVRCFVVNSSAEPKVFDTSNAEGDALLKEVLQHLRGELKLKKESVS